MAFSEVLLVFPAALFFATGVLRFLQPAGREPAHAAAQIFAWFGETSRAGAATMLLALPALVLIIGVIVLIRTWRADAELRMSARAAGNAVWRYLTVYLLAATTALAGGILIIVVSHIITD